MKEAGVDVGYLAAGANRHTAVADWGEDGILAFGADCNVALWQPEVSLSAFFFVGLSCVFLVSLPAPPFPPFF